MAHSLIRLYESSASVDVVTLDLALLIRVMEWAREDAADDAALHRLAEAMDALEGPLTMADWPRVLSAIEDDGGTGE